MWYPHILLLPAILGFSVEDIHPPLWTSSPNTWIKYKPEEEGTCSSAVDMMAFHREKMNEYLCRKFLAEEIVEAEGDGEIQDRALPPLMDDAGSAGYKDWLSRSTTLEDIYRQYEQNTAEDAPIGQALPPGDFDGEVTGYAMLGNKVSAAETSGYGAGTSYGVPQYGTTVIKAESSKGMKLNDLFQLALTAIAFLAFGTFIIEVIMCLMGLDHKNHETNVMMVMGEGEPLQAINHYKDGTSRRSRSVEIQLNQLAAKATATLDGIEILHRDEGKQLQQTLCQANQFSRSLDGTTRMWLPLWSFGMSWIGGRHLAMTTDSRMGTLKFLTATIQGMAGVNCSTMLL